MLRKKKKKDDERDYMYLQALKNKKIPLLVLDPQWHELFPEHRKTSEIKNCEKRLNELIKIQGQTANNIKEYDKAKKAIMDNIVSNMTDGSEPDSFLKARKQEKNQKLMANLNDKISEAEEIQKEIPAQIQLANRELLVEAMKVCYNELTSNTEQIEELEAWIAETRNNLKDRILEKQDMEMRNTQMYKYMHNLLGAQVVE
ncbi:MAG: hypothetical protein K2K35_10575, partial [Lachnospiraceae bacterium]|nr:hypothetical protein [Lachnospiraceae bacterium]